MISKKGGSYLRLKYKDLLSNQDRGRNRGPLGGAFGPPAGADGADCSALDMGVVDSDDEELSRRRLGMTQYPGCSKPVTWITH